MNIVFKTPQGIAVTTLGEAENSKQHAKFLLTLGGFEDWEAVAYDVLPEFFPAWPHQGDWRWDGSKIVVDLEAARVSTADRLRAERVPAFAALDLEYMRTLESKGDTAAIVAKKDVLRNLPDQVKYCSTLEELAALHV